MQLQIHDQLYDRSIKNLRVSKSEIKLAVFFLALMLYLGIRAFAFVIPYDQIAYTINYI